MRYIFIADIKDTDEDSFRLANLLTWANEGYKIIDKPLDVVEVIKGKDFRDVIYFFSISSHVKETGFKNFLYNLREYLTWEYDVNENIDNLNKAIENYLAEKGSHEKDNC